MKVRIRIETEAEGNTSVFESDGERTDFPEGIRLQYGCDGDRSELVVQKDGFSMQRTGASGLSARFIKGQPTFLFLTFEGGEGKAPVSTEEYSATVQEDFIFVLLAYRLHFGQETQKFQLKIYVRRILEEK